MSDLPQDNITHDGLISHMTKDVITVMIISKASCASCSVKGACSASDVEEKNVDVKRALNDNYNVGDKVVVMMDQSLGTWAVMFGYVFPFLVLLIGLIVFTQLLDNEGIAGLLSLLLLIPYYTILYLSRKQMEKTFQFKIIG
ncbi:MAG: SoxR reducing system RseC family protein [Bacteroidales bacterium]|nr:SoxR reducing system RseC family protein [Bacteroidales bacterium]RLD38895.1 MAG: RseC/MucC family positive regulator of sigma(E) [Bacteroidota bacterium]